MESSVAPEGIEQAYSEKALRQLINAWTRIDSLDNCQHLWGDEIEYQALRFDDRLRTVRVDTDPKRLSRLADRRVADWADEIPTHQLEARPLRPYDAGSFDQTPEGLIASIERYEWELGERNRMLRDAFSDVRILPLTAMPRYGAGTFYHTTGDNASVTIDPDSGLPDCLLHDNAISRAMLAFFRTRRHNDASESQFPLLDGSRMTLRGITVPFSTGSLQVTQQFRNRRDALFAYDQLAALAPVFLALTAATPARQGRLGESDSRWLNFSAAVDWRSRCERQVFSS